MILSKHDIIKFRLFNKLINYKPIIEAPCRIGKIDILTNTEAIEIKPTKNWKHAVGQALTYGISTNKSPRIHLYGSKRLCNNKEKIIKDLGIRLTYDLDEIKNN